MRYYFSVLVLLFSANLLFAQQIDSVLLKNADNVVLDKTLTINTLKNNGIEWIYQVKYLLLNKKAKDKSRIVIPYDEFSTAEFISGSITYGDGEEKKIKKKDFNDYSAVSGFSLYEENRVLYYSYEPTTYPVIVEYAYKITKKHNFFTYFFSPIEEYGQSVLKASLILNTAPDKAFQIKTYGSAEPEVLEGEDRISRTWKLAAMPAIEWEPFAVDIRSRTSGVMLAPVHFKFDGYEGSNESWASLGKWIHLLQEGRLELPEAAKEDVRKITENYPEPYEKAKAIYEYMQAHTRYVSIQLGIGGFQPFNANTVHELGYGDCKALTNYTQALFHEAGIESYYSLVKAGSNAYELEDKFTANQFNHVILCLPLDSDTIWMECTSQKMPFGFLGDFTDNRPALLIKENGSTLVKTPRYDIRHNQSFSATNLLIEPNGNARLTVDRLHRGLHYDNISHYPSLDPREIRKQLGKNTGWKNYTIDQVNISEEKSRIPELSLSYQVDVLALGSTSGNRIFLPANPIKTYEPEVPRVRSRQTPFAVYHDELYSDTLLINFPVGYQLERSLEAKAIESEFGSYKQEIKALDEQLIIIRTLSLFAGRWESSQYQAFYEFHESIKRNDLKKLVFVKRE